MMKTLLAKVFGTRQAREVRRMMPVVHEIHRHEERLSGLSEEELKAQTARFRERIAERTGALKRELDEVKAAKHHCEDPAERGRLDQRAQTLELDYKKALAAVLDELLPEAFAPVREACRRLLGTTVTVTGHELAWDMVPYDVQLIGGMVLHRGMIAEMATGEGKTLVATLPLYLNALAGRGAHLVTVNNYLARRDSQWMGHVYRYLGLTVGCIADTEPPSPARSLQRRHHLRHQQRVRLRLPPRQHGVLAGAAGAAGARLRHRGRGGLDPDRRGPHPAHHQRPGRQRGGRQVRPVQPPGVRAGAAADRGGEPAHRGG